MAAFVVVQLSLVLLASAPQADPAVAEAKRHLAARDLDAVFFALERRTLGDNSRDEAADTLAAAAMLALEAKDDVFALQLAQMALSHRSKHPRALEAAARAKLAQLQFADAEALAERWIDATAGTDALLFRAALALSQGEWERALELATDVSARKGLVEKERAEAKRIGSAARREVDARVSARRDLERIDRDATRAAEEGARGTLRRGQLASAADRAAAASGVIVYGFEGCPPCISVKWWLDKNGVPYIYKDIDNDPAANAELQAKRRARGITHRGVPVTDVRGTFVQGGKLPELEAAARAAGLLK